MHEKHIAVVGAGLGGLATALLLAKAGHRVTVYEQARADGGRAATQDKNGFHFNLGGHALYEAGEAAAFFKRMNIPIRGKRPPSTAAFGDDEHLYQVTGSPLSYVTSGLTSVRAMFQGAKALTALARGRLAGPDLTAREWLRQTVPDAQLRRMLEALIRTSNFTSALERLSAAAAIHQLNRALRGVRYVDGGWQQLVDSLHERAVAAGAHIHVGARVDEVLCEQGRVTGIQLANGEQVRSDAVVICADPQAASALLPGSATLQDAARKLVPMRAACLDLGLSRLPKPENWFALGLDRPVYLSAQSLTAAEVAPEGTVLVHVLRYLHPDQGGDDPRADLEWVLDRAQPGWRELVVEQRYLPHVTVTNALPELSLGGLAGRPGTRVADVDGAFLVGDWVGPDGMLSDAVFASAQAAARELGTAAARASA